MPKKRRFGSEKILPYYQEVIDLISFCILIVLEILAKKVVIRELR